jgi:hypothetical protein
VVSVRAVPNDAQMLYLFSRYFRLHVSSRREKQGEQFRNRTVAGRLCRMYQNPL